MPFDYQLLLLAHVLLFVYWLGGDLGVFYSSFVVADAKQSVASRVTAAKILVALDQVPRICLVLILPVGLMLAHRTQLLPLTSSMIVVICLATLFWLGLIVALHVVHTRALTIVDTVFRVGVAASALGAAGIALADTGVTPVRWLAAKLGVFGLIVFCGLAIRAVFAPFGQAFAALATTGSNPKIEADIHRALSRARPFVLAIWVLLIAAAWLGLTKPVLR